MWVRGPKDCTVKTAAGTPSAISYLCKKSGADCNLTWSLVAEKLVVAVVALELRPNCKSYISHSLSLAWHLIINLKEVRYHVDIKGLE
jgi:hypothetical protein